VTPTGAALLTTWKNTERVPAGAKIIRAGYGFGHFELRNRPNLLRAILFDYPKASGDNEECLVIECNLDDMSPELTGNLANRLLAQGALDVFITPVQMKKNRPGVMLTILCLPNKRDEMLELIFRESTTFGVREYNVRRTVLPRRFATVKTPYGKVRVKIGSWQGKEITRAPEYEDCRKAAEKAKVPLRRIYEAALASRKCRMQPAAG
ncbi:MAG: LarC family nickel insertion protein, partial [Kiritimatiellia bacterium]|nr:LarC family nickel insertion protein [Kiritimatiellia bacterium]